MFGKLLFNRFGLVSIGLIKMVKFIGNVANNFGHTAFL
jgi:hypothetical protein